MNTNELMKIAAECAIQAGEAMLEIYAQDFEVEFKSDDSPLTAADKAAHRIIVAALEQTPYPVLSEESAAVSYEERSSWTTYWLVDPLDGTKEFIKKNGEFTVNIALIDQGIPVAGVVYVPVEATLYLGLENGAFKVAQCVGKSIDELIGSATSCRISQSPSTPLRIVASKSHCNDETRSFIADLEARYGAVELVSRGSSLKLCMVAEGSADIYPRIAPTMEWDTAAAHAVVRAAGGAVFEFNPSVSAADYLCTPDAQESFSAMLRYNKENLLNPYFVVSGLCK
ncbi:MAG: 3'(2'),5'-bisphosphate nucleotidase CysQ [Pontiellaceae bacterium]|nr:3'(2'),5'-bisphosphate nucleotidase CysQ [Pontiellaceae bacterium]MBN2784517.1 3'(2'),5'-bisphosphate nucleotidase CysQ [Pontiellaceae bacterium]